ncbi:oxidoreductase [Burkholderia pseudomallei]|nr:oxidoreductase [Burkholderia pseudomallei]
MRHAPCGVWRVACGVWRVACARPHVPRPPIRCAGMPAVGAKAMRLPRALNRGPPRSPIRSSQ